MSVLNFTGFEQSIQTTGNGGYDTNAFQGTGGSIVTSPVRTGTYSARFNKVTSANPFMEITTIFQADGTLLGGNTQANLSTAYLQFAFYSASRPTSASEQIASIFGTDGNAKISLRIDSTGKLSLYDSDNTTQIGSTGATVLALNTWYEIQLSVGSGASAPYALNIDNVSELSGTYTLANSNNSGKMFIGSRADMNSVSMDNYYDDVLVDDASFHNTAVVKAIIPTANGSSMTWSAGSGASDYTQVNEIPPDDGTTNYVMTPSNGTNPNSAMFALQNTSTVSISGTILSVKGVIMTRESASNVSAHFIRVTSGATNSDSSAFNGSTTLQGQSRVLNVDPNTSSAWTTSAIDALEIGAVENNNVAVRCASVMGFVLYIPSTSIEYILTASTGTFALTYIDTIVSRVRVMIASVGSFILTGMNANLSSSAIWTTITKSITSWSNSSKNSTSFNNQSKNSTSWTNRNKS